MRTTHGPKFFWPNREFAPKKEIFGSCLISSRWWREDLVLLSLLVLFISVLLFETPGGPDPEYVHQSILITVITILFVIVCVTVLALFITHTHLFDQPVSSY